MLLRKSPVAFLLSTLRNIYVLLGEVIYMVRKHSRRSCTVGVQKYFLYRRLCLGTVTNIIETYAFR